jgi:hypothetical protein
MDIHLLGNFLKFTPFTEWDYRDMGWTIDKTKARFSNLGNAAQAKWDEFQNAVHQTGKHPAEVARQIGDSDYKALNPLQYQIRLGYADRATFTLDEGASIVRVLQVGGHT